MMFMLFFSHFHYCLPQIFSFQHSHERCWHLLKSFVDVFVILDFTLHQNNNYGLISFSKWCSLLILATILSGIQEES